MFKNCDIVIVTSFMIIIGPILKDDWTDLLQQQKKTP